MLEPCAGVAKASFDPEVAALPSARQGLDEPSLAEHREVLRDCGAGDVELRGDLSRGELPVGDEAQNPTPAWLGDRPDGGFHDARSFSRRLRKAQLTYVAADSIGSNVKGAAWPS